MREKTRILHDVLTKSVLIPGHEGTKGAEVFSGPKLLERTDFEGGSRTGTRLLSCI